MKTNSKKKKSGKSPERNEPLLLSYQQAARCLGLTKGEVKTMADDGLLRSVHAGGKPCVTARSISHMLGYDPFGQATALSGGRYTNLTFEQYDVKLLNRGVRKARSRATDNYRCGLHMAAAELGGIRIAEIGEDDLRRAFRQLAPKYSKNTLRLAYTATRFVLRAAYQAGDIPDDPTRHWEMPRSSKPQRADAGRVYSDAEIEAILRTSREYNPELYTMFAVLASTGMRPGELLALEWSGFDPQAKTLHIYQAVTREFGKIQELGRAASSRSVISVPKTEYSVRTLRLSDAAVNALVAWRRTLRKDKSRARARSRYIFPGNKGKFRSLSGAEALLQRYRKACDMPGVTFYKFRHTMCTRLALDRQPISVIQRVLGDNSPDVITRVYTHVDADDALRAMESYFAAQNG